MSTDNSTVLRNSVGRSFFTIPQKRKTTQKIGCIGVSGCTIALPNETVSLKRGEFYELKPTTNRIASSCEAHNMSVSVPFRSVMRYWDEFISKGDLIVQNGAMNVPIIQHREDQSVYQLPFTTPKDIIGGLLASICSQDIQNPSAKLCFMREVDIETTIYDMPEGNVQKYDYSSVNANGLYCATTEYYRTNFLGAPYWWWLPRLIGNGYNESGVNLNCIAVPTRTGYKIRGCVHFSDLNSIQMARVCYEMFKAQHPSDTFRLQTNEVQCLKFVFETNPESGDLNFGIAVGDNAYELLTDPTSEASSELPLPFTCITTPNNPNGTFGTILMDDTLEWNPLDYEDYWTIGFTPLVLNDAHAGNAFFVQTLITALFNRSSLLGYGSLMESFGHSLFEPKTIYDIYTEYFGVDYPVALGASFDAVFDVLNENLFRSYLLGDDSLEISDKVNIIPYLCYQKTCTDRFLLDHEILSNNTGEDSQIDFDTKFDSPYWRNNMVPTMYYGHPSKDEDANVLHRSSFYYNNTWYLAEDSTPIANMPAEQKHYIISLNSMLTIFLDRGTLLSMDAFTKIWQKENRNVQNILDLAGYGVKTDGTIEAKQFLLAKKLCQYVMYGNTDQLASQVLEKHFGVNDVPTNHREVVVLDMDRQTLAVQDVMNQGGGVDSQGNNIALGDKVSIMSNSTPERQVFECYEKEFSYVLNLHWFSIDFERYNVPNPSVKVLEDIQTAESTLGDVRRAFQLALFPEFQATGDEMLHLDDIEVFSPSINVSWTNKNNTLKDGYSEYMGEWKNRFLKQLWTPYLPYRRSPYAPSLTYGYLQPTPFQYDLHLLDRFGDAFLCGHLLTWYKKSIMTKSNEVGLVGF